jgi:hypothetical protein
MATPPSAITRDLALRAREEKVEAGLSWRERVEARGGVRSCDRVGGVAPASLRFDAAEKRLVRACADDDGGG